MSWFRGAMAAAGVALATTAQAAVITVTGGDTGQGLTIDPSRVVYAVDFGGGAASTVQGVNFVTSHANITADGNNGFDPGDVFASGETSTNDVNLESIVRSGRFFDFASGKITISGLSENAPYQVDLLVSGGGRTQTVAYNNGAVVDTQALASGVAYNFTNLVESQGTSLIVNMNVTQGFANSVFSGIVVSNPVPEPSTIAAVGLGSLMLVRRRRR